MNPNAEAHTELPQDNATQRALAILQQGVTDLTSSDGWRQMLAFREQLHPYSFFNTALIRQQKPTAVFVAGYKKWAYHRRAVRKGEKGIMILAPVLRSVEVDGEAQTAPVARVLVGFKPVYVFDISQTDGDLVTIPASRRLLNLDGPRVRDALSRVETYAKQLGLTLRYDLPESRALGSYSPKARLVRLRDNLPALQRLKTLIHEIAHAKLDHSTRDRPMAELEAESCAFLVCHRLGLDTSRYSFPYLAGWSPSPNALVQAGQRASETADEIFDAMFLAADERLPSSPPAAPAPDWPIGARL